ncbi:MAG: hypothetical protein K8R53_11940 [Bacteroidales bacterium]|nr:hypothetical protein [Bacteroidales bacterium]
METRIGYPNEHLSQNVPEEMASPMYATGVGLVIEGASRLQREKTYKKDPDSGPRKFLGIIRNFLKDERIRNGE